MIEADRFHVVRLVNQHFSRLWQQHDPEGRKNRGLLTLMRRHHWKLAAAQNERLHQYLAQAPVASGAVLCQAAIEWFSGHEVLEWQAGQADVARIPHAVRMDSGILRTTACGSWPSAVRTV